ncbi:MAG TPA: hypothetical protein VK907_04550 [Phnomibacter sp.]|nr:hypothetical protein [Phnomibacter sp.]
MTILRPIQKVFRPLVFAIALPAFLLFLACSGSQKNASVWKSPTYQPVPYQKLLVFAQMDDATDRRMLEDAMVAALRQQGTTAMVTYNDITGSDAANADAIGARAIALGADGLIAFSKARVGNEYRQGPNISASVGMPVRVGFANIWLGGQVPLGGGGRNIPIAHMDASFYNRDAKGPLWTMKISEKITAGAGQVSQAIANKAARQLKRDAIVQ